jgi:hypothetical protein
VNRPRRLQMRHAHALTLRPLLAPGDVALDPAAVLAAKALQMGPLLTARRHAGASTAVHLAPAIALSCSSASHFLASRASAVANTQSATLHALVAVGARATL